METLLDSCYFSGGTAIYSVVHKDDNSISIVIPYEDDALSYLGLTNVFSIPIGSMVEVTDDEGERHEITRLT